MTIFLRVLKKLIKEQLNVTSQALKYQIDHPGIYIQLLSSQKKTIIDALEEKIVKFVGTGNDEADSKVLNKFVEDARVLVQDKHELHKKPRDSGETVAMLSNLIFHTNQFYAKLDKFNKVDTSEIPDKSEGPVKLRLINHPFHNTPENLIYECAACYIGGEIFEPSTKIDLRIRNQKEEAVLTRIQALSEVIKPSFGLHDRKERSIQALKDLSSDNLKIITPEPSSSYSLPFISLGGFFSVRVPITLFDPSEGRFGSLFNLTNSQVAEMSELEFRPAEESSSASVEHSM
jgi:uncharacterized protein YllA (UPF0747 family)